ncbi:hypothetical protein HK102_010685, partial [Quaeritorhiza haematococci]
MDAGSIDGVNGANASGAAANAADPASLYSATLGIDDIITKNVSCCGVIYPTYEDLLKHHEQVHSIPGARNITSNIRPIATTKPGGGLTDGRHGRTAYREKRRDRDMSPDSSPERSPIEPKSPAPFAVDELLQLEKELNEIDMDIPRQGSSDSQLPKAQPINIFPHQNQQQGFPTMPIGGNIDMELSALLAAQADIDPTDDVLAKRRLSVAAFSLGSYVKAELKRFRDDF